MSLNRQRRNVGAQARGQGRPAAAHGRDTPGPHGGARAARQVACGQPAADPGVRVRRPDRGRHVAPDAPDGPWRRWPGAPGRRALHRDVRRDGHGAGRGRNVQLLDRSRAGRHPGADVRGRPRDHDVGERAARPRRAQGLADPSHGHGRDDRRRGLRQHRQDDSPAGHLGRRRPGGWIRGPADRVRTRSIRRPRPCGTRCFRPFPDSTTRASPRCPTAPASAGSRRTTWSWGRSAC